MAYNPMTRVRHQCDCWRTHTYPDHVVLSLYHERRRLTRINRELREEVDRRLAVEEAQTARIRELEAEVRATTERLTRVVRVARDRTGGIVAECEKLIGRVLEASREEVNPAVGPPSDVDMGGDPMTESPGAAAVVEADLP